MFRVDPLQFVSVILVGNLLDMIVCIPDIDCAIYVCVGFRSEFLMRRELRHGFRLI